MKFGIFVHATASTGEPVNKWLMDYDVDAHEGKGGVVFTRFPHRALQFASMAEAVKVWQTQSKVKPLRDDGLPNRPLTSFHTEIRRIP